MSGSIILVNPSTGRAPVTRADQLRGYLSLGALASALRRRSFLNEFARRRKINAITYLPQKEFQPFAVQLADLSMKPSHYSIDSFLSDSAKKGNADPILIGMTATSAQLEEASAVASAAARAFPGALRVIGGPHVSVLPEEILERTDFHVACVGDGTETIVELALRLASSAGLKLAEVPGIVYKSNEGTIQKNRHRRFLFSMDEYPFPSESLDLFLDDRDDSLANAREVVFVLAGTGCPYDCAFCAQRRIHGGLIRERSAEGIFREVQSLHMKGFRRFALVQETFLSRRKRVERFCELIEQSGLDLEWTVEARADQLDLGLLKRMRRAGLRFIQVGLETGDQQLLDSLNKRIHLNQVARFIAWCKELKIDTTLYMLVGLPGQGWSSILRSAEFIRRNLPYNRATMHASVAIAIPYPGTRLAKEGSVRMLPRPGHPLDFPVRAPLVTFDDSGRIVGESLTETDAMSSQEILEAFVLLDDYCHFLLHGHYDHTMPAVERMRSLEMAGRIYSRIRTRAEGGKLSKKKSGTSP